MKYSQLARLYEDLSSTTKRLEKISVLSDFLKKLPKKDKDVLYLLLGDIYPEYDERRIGISNQLVIRVLSKSTGVSAEDIVKEWKGIGDLGIVAEKIVSQKKQTTLHTKTLTTEKVIENLRKLPELEGKGTVGRKLDLISELMTSASGIEAKYLARTLIGDLRMGVQESTVRDALASAFFKRDEKTTELIQRAIDRSNDLAEVFEFAFTKKLKELQKIHLVVGKPIKAMLCQKVTTISDGFKKVGKPCAVEYKYDGFRMIIHKNKKQVMLFTRSLENVTNQFPEVVDYIHSHIKGESFILDSEAVGFDKKTKEYKPFQYISQRIRRKHNIRKLQEQMPVEVNVFDVLFYGGKSLLNEPFEKRTELVRKIIRNKPYKLIHAKQIITGDEKKASEFYRKALKDNQEGIMMKNLKSPYRPGRRVGNMVKMKPEEKDLDLVITGAEYGTGKRSGWMSSFILSCKKGSEYAEIGKVGTGIAEKDNEITFESLTKLLTPLITKEKGKTVWIKPKVVAAVTYQEIQKSPNYNSGWALRFPRFTALRPDKHLSEITTLEEIKKDFGKQKRNWRYG